MSVSRSLVCVGGGSLWFNQFTIKVVLSEKTENENRQKREMKSECMSIMLLFTHLRAVVNE